MSRKSFNIHLINNTSTMTDFDEDGNIVTKITLFDQIIEFVWIQGIITSKQISNQFIIDDGTGCITVILDPSLLSDSDNELNNNIDIEYNLCDYVLVQGIIYKGNIANTCELITCVNALIISKIADPNMETLWSLEVIESYRSDSK